MTGSFLVCGWFLSCGFGDDGIHVDRVDHVVEVFGLVFGEWLPVPGSIHDAVEGDSPQGSDESDGFFDFGTMQAANNRRVGVAYVTSCQVCGVEWVDFCCHVEAGEGWCDECAIHESVLLSVVYGLLWFLECVGCDPTVKVALKPSERFIWVWPGMWRISLKPLWPLSASQIF